MNCLECKDGSQDLTATVCYRRALNAFQKEVNIDSVATSHYLQTQYFGDSVELFKALSELRSDLEELGKRDPQVDFKAQKKKGRFRSKCPKCPANPQNIFPGLKIILMKNPKEFIVNLKKVLTDMEFKDKTSACGECRDLTREEIGFALGSYRKLIGTVVPEKEGEPCRQ